MAGASNTEEAKLLDDRLDAISVWVGLSSTTPTETGTNITEPSTGAGYARVEIDGTLTGWDAAVAGAPTTKSNAGTVTFPQATADWLAQANLTHFVLMDSATVGGGNMLYFGEIRTPKAVLDTDTARFDAGEIDVMLGDPGDSYL